MMDEAEVYFILTEKEYKSKLDDFCFVWKTNEIWGVETSVTERTDEQNQEVRAFTDEPHPSAGDIILRKYVSMVVVYLLFISENMRRKTKPF